MSLPRVPSFSNRPGFPAGLRVLVVEPGSDDFKLITGQLEECNYEVTGCTSEAEADKVLKASEAPFDVVMCETSIVSSAQSSQPAFVSQLEAVPLVLMGENTSQEQQMLGIKLDAVDFLEKPVSLLKLRNIWQHTVRKMLKQRSASTTSVPGVVDSPEALAASKSGASRAAPGEAGNTESSGSSRAEPSGKATPAARPQPGTTKKQRAVGECREGASHTRRSGQAATRPQRSTDSSSKESAAAAQPAQPATTQSHTTQPPPSSSAAPQAPATALTGMMQQYSLQGMPAPLPGCVWGLPMLPPPVPGLVGAPMMWPMNGMMAPHQQPPQPQPQMAAQWVKQPYTGGMQPALTGHPGMPVHHPHCMPPPRPCMVSPGKDSAAHCGTAAHSASLTTWSHDASAATHLHSPANWDDVDVFALTDDTDALDADLSDDLLKGCDAGAAGKGAAFDCLGDGLGSDNFWMDDEHIYDDEELKGLGKTGSFLDIIGQLGDCCEVVGASA